jgi:hypothetical protein
MQSRSVTGNALEICYEMEGYDETQRCVDFGFLFSPGPYGRSDSRTGSKARKENTGFRARE